jgi:hypothetical protein
MIIDNPPSSQEQHRQAQLEVSRRGSCRERLLQLFRHEAEFELYKQYSRLHKKTVFVVKKM